jgi:hypothetical protein
MQAATGLEWSDMLFFDDESGNVHKVRLGGRDGWGRQSCKAACSENLDVCDHIVCHLHVPTCLLSFCNLG